MISPENSKLRNAVGCVAFLLFIPIFLLVKIIATPFEKPIDRTPDEVVGLLVGFLEGTVEDWDWDDFMGISIADPRLEDIRERAFFLQGDKDVEPLKELIADAKAIAENDRAARHNPVS